MFEYLEKLRKKTDREKKYFALGVAFCFCLIVSGFWVVSVYPTLIREKEVNDKVSKIKSSGPAESFTSTFSSAWGDLKANIIDIKTTISDFNSDINYYKSTSTQNSTSTQTFEVKTGWTQTSDSQSIATSSEQNVFGGM